MLRDMKNNACDPATRILPFEYYDCHNIENTSMKDIVISGGMGAAYLVSNLIIVSGLDYAARYAYNSDWQGAAVALSGAGAAVFFDYCIFNTIEKMTDSVHFLEDYVISGAIDKFCDTTGICSELYEDMNKIAEPVYCLEGYIRAGVDKFCDITGLCSQPEVAS